MSAAKQNKARRTSVLVKRSGWFELVGLAQRFEVRRAFRADRLRVQRVSFPVMATGPKFPEWVAPPWNRQSKGRKSRHSRSGVRFMRNLRHECRIFRGTDGFRAALHPRANARKHVFKCFGSDRLDEVPVKACRA